MEPTPFPWFDHPNLWPIGFVLLALLTGALFLGRWLRAQADSGAPNIARKRDLDGYIVSAMLGLLAVLLGFTFSLATSRYEARRLLVVTQASTIKTVYHRAQLLTSPHKDRISRLLQSYLASQIALERAGFPATGLLRTRADQILTSIWSEAIAALSEPQNQRLAIIVGNALTSLIEQDDFRKAARSVHVPTEVFIVLVTCLISIAGVLGFAIKKDTGTVVACFALGMMTLSLLLIIDIDRPGSGGIRESQAPMERLQYGWDR
jgi:predicted membrane protein